MSKVTGLQIVVPNTEFRLNTGNGGNSQSFKSLNELIDTLRIAIVDWKRAEGRGKAAFKFSETYAEVLEFIEKDLISGISEENLKSI